MSPPSRITCMVEETGRTVLPTGHRLVAGWILAAGVADPVTVRVRGDRRVLLAWSGLPRPDVAAAHPVEPGAAFSGFRAELPADLGGPVRLEWRGGTEPWQEFWRESDHDADRAAAGFRPSLPDHRWPWLLEQAAGGFSRQSWRAAWDEAGDWLTEAVTEFLPWTPPDDFTAFLDEPSAERCTGDFVSVSGWVFARSGLIRRVWVHAGTGAAGHVVHPLVRPDVVAAYPDVAVPPACGFRGLVRLPPGKSGTLILRVYAETADGTVGLVGLQRLFRCPDNPARSGGRRAMLLLAARVLGGQARPQTVSRWCRGLGQALRGPSAPPEPAAAETARPAAAQPVTALLPESADPLISLVVPVYNPPARYLQAMLASVRAQSYPRWELCLADDASTAPHVRPLLEAAARADARIRVVFRPANGQIARASNTALEIARGTFVAFLDHDDLLAPAALAAVVAALRTQPAADFLYTDRDKVDEAGRHFDVERRGAWNPAMAITHNYLHQLTVIRRTVVVRAGSFRADYYGSQDLDLYLRCHELVPADRIVHVPVVAYHWRAHPGSTASRGDQKDYMFASARRGIEEAVRRRGLRATPFLPDFAPIYGLNLHQLRWDPGLLAENPVSIVFAVEQPAGPWREALAAVRRTVPAAVEIIVVAAGPLVAPPPAATVIAADPGTSLAALFNLGAAAARQPLLLLLQAGWVPQGAGWLEDLVGWLSVPGVDAAGPKLVQADGRLASAGWTLDAVTGRPQPLLAGEAPEDLGHQFLLHAARDSLLLDPACVLTRTARFLAAGGYADGDFPSTSFAADYCLRLRTAGRRTVFSPQAVLRAVGPAIASSPLPAREEAVFKARHHGCDDPWIHPSFRGRSEPAAATGMATPPWMPGDTVRFGAGWFYLENPQPHETLPAGRQVLGGWCIAFPGEVVTDLRVRIGRRRCALVFGHPRPDLAALWASTEPFFPVGFDLELDLPPGRAVLEFEARAASGWQPITRIEVSVGSVSDPRPSGVPGRVTAGELAAAAAWLAARPAEADRLAGEIPWRYAVRHPAPPFCGHLNEPPLLVEPVYGGIEVRGWLLHEAQVIRRVVGSCDFAPALALPHRRESALIQADFRDYPGAAQCALSGFLPLPNPRASTVTLRLWAELPDGSWHLVYLQRCLLRPATTTGAAAPRRGLLLAHATVLRGQLWQQGIPGPWWPLASAPATVGGGRPHTKLPRWPAWVPRPAPAEPQVLLVTHNLNREGAPAFLLELAGHLRRHTGVRLTVVSPFDGPLRAEFGRRGIAVRLIDRTPLWKARGAAATRQALAEMGRALRAEDVSLVVANTIESFWAVAAAHQAGRPSLFYVHEPGVLGRHYLGQVDGAVQAAAAAAVRQATAVSFPGRAAADYYRAFAPGTNFVIQPGWTEGLPPGDAGRARAAQRARLGLRPEDRLVLNVGTVCARKDQLGFVEAVRRLAAARPDLVARGRFRLIGDHGSDYGEMVVDRVARLPGVDLAVCPATPHIADYYAAADLFVLSSHEEGFPRVLLEAMQHGLPIVSTAIHTIPEIVRDGREALLVPAGDCGALAAAMGRLLEDPEYARHLGARARRRLENRFTAAAVIPGHLRTLLRLAPDLLADAPRNRPAKVTAFDRGVS